MDRTPNGYRRQNLDWRTAAQKRDPQINNLLRESHRYGAKHSKEGANQFRASVLLNYLHAELKMGAHIGPTAYRIRKRIDVETSTTLAFDQSQHIDAAEIGNREFKRLKLELSDLSHMTPVIAAACMTRSVLMHREIRWSFRIGRLVMLVVVMLVIMTTVIMAMLMGVRIMTACRLMLVSASGVAKSVVHTAPERHVKHDGNARDFYQ